MGVEVAIKPLRRKPAVRQKRVGYWVVLQDASVVGVAINPPRRKPAVRQKRVVCWAALPDASVVVPKQPTINLRHPAVQAPVVRRPLVVREQRAPPQQ